MAFAYDLAKINKIAQTPSLSVQYGGRYCPLKKAVYKVAVVTTVVYVLFQLGFIN